MILDCYSPESAAKSLCEIFDTTERELLSLISSVNPANSTLELPHVIYDQACERFGAPCTSLKVAWFHGTRVEDHYSFYQWGVLPNTAAKKVIGPRLKELAEGLENSGEKPFSPSFMDKQGGHNEGPFAFLIRDGVIHAPGAHHSYVQTPEMVEDFASLWFGTNSHQLIARYQDVAKSYVVTFVVDSVGHELPHALLYLKLIEDGHSKIEAAEIANTCFCGDGSAIPPEQIRNVEQIENV